MPHNIKCQKCNHEISYISSDIGNIIKCIECGTNNELISPTMKDYKLPEVIWIKVTSYSSKLTSNIAIMFDYGFKFGPIFTNENSIATLSKKYFSESYQDEISTGIMDHKNNYFLNDNLLIIIPSKKNLIQYINNRKNSVWNLLEHEKKRWESISKLEEKIISASNFNESDICIKYSLKSNETTININI